MLCLPLLHSLSLSHRPQHGECVWEREREKEKEGDERERERESDESPSETNELRAKYTPSADELWWWITASWQNSHYFYISNLFKERCILSPWNPDGAVGWWVMRRRAMGTSHLTTKKNHRSQMGCVCFQSPRACFTLCNTRHILRASAPPPQTEPVFSLECTDDTYGLNYLYSEGRSMNRCLWCSYSVRRCVYTHRRRKRPINPSPSPKKLSSTWPIMQLFKLPCLSNFKPAVGQLVQRLSVMCGLKLRDAVPDDIIVVYYYSDFINLPPETQNNPNKLFSRTPRNEHASLSFMRRSIDVPLNQQTSREPLLGKRPVGRLGNEIVETVVHLDSLSQTTTFLLGVSRHSWSITSSGSITVLLEV